MTATPLKQLQDHFWRTYEDARRRRDLAQNDTELTAAGNAAAAAWSGFIVAHNPHCPHCGAILNQEGAK